MINSNLTLDEAFRLHKKQLDHLDAALAKIKEFPFSQYLHVGFDSGLTKATTFIYNLEYKLPFTLNDTQFIGTAVGVKRYLPDVKVPQEWVKEHLAFKNPKVTLGFKLTYRSDKDQWSIKCSQAFAPLHCKGHYNTDYYVITDDDCSTIREVNNVIGYGANSKDRTSVARKSDDVGFYIKLFQMLLPFLMNDNIYGVRSILSDAANTKALNSLK